MGGTFDPEDTWGAPRWLARNYAGHPDVAADGAGNAIAIWIGNWYSGGPVWASRFVGGRWQSPEEVWSGDGFQQLGTLPA